MRTYKYNSNDIRIQSSCMGVSSDRLDSNNRFFQTWTWHYIRTRTCPLHLQARLTDIIHYPCRIITTILFILQRVYLLHSLPVFISDPPLIQTWAELKASTGSSREFYNYGYSLGFPFLDSPADHHFSFLFFLVVENE